MENVLNDKELNELGKALSKPINKAAFTVGMCNLILGEASTTITIIQSSGPNRPVTGQYKKVRGIIIDCIMRCVNTIKRVPGPYETDDVVYEDFLRTVSILEDSIKGAMSVNPDTIIISNFWYSIKPTFVALVNLLSGCN